MNGLADVFLALADPRRPNARQHKLLDVLIIAFCVCLCGAESCVNMADFAAKKALRVFLNPARGRPSLAADGKCNEIQVVRAAVVAALTRRLHDQLDALHVQRQTDECCGTRVLINASSG